MPAVTEAKRVAVVQPYFFPYAGYFRLFAQVDEVVIFDCVQFPRRGRVHRCEVPGPTGAVEWLTLPLARQAREVRIKDLAFVADSTSIFAGRLARLPWISGASGPDSVALLDFLRRPEGGVVDYLEEGLRLVTFLLGLTPVLRRSSTLGIDPALRGQERLIATVRAVGGTRYLNAPGGRELYDPAAFAAAGVALEFLPPYTGAFFHLLPALLAGQAAALRAESPTWQSDT